jgi:hypothetical protein
MRYWYCFLVICAESLPYVYFNAVSYHRRSAQRCSPSPHPLLKLLRLCFPVPNHAPALPFGDESSFFTLSCFCLANIVNSTRLNSRKTESVLRDPKLDPPSIVMNQAVPALYRGQFMIFVTIGAEISKNAGGKAEPF